MHGADNIKKFTVGLFHSSFATLYSR